MTTHVTLKGIEALLGGRHERPLEVLGPHEVECEGRKAVAIRAYLPHTKHAWICPRSQRQQAMRRIHPAGFFEAICPWTDQAEAIQYQLRIEDESGNQRTMHDPYSFPPLLSEFDLYLMGEGRHWNIYEKLGAHLRTIDDVSGVNFAVWAPNAPGVSVIGDFNDWDGRRHPMHKHYPSGVWELFLPDLQEGCKYKFRIHGNWYTTDKFYPC